MGCRMVWSEWKTEEEIKKKEFKEQLTECQSGNHKFTGWFCAPQGLAHQCRVCGYSEWGKIVNGEFMLNPPLDKDGFLDKSKL